MGTPSRTSLQLDIQSTLEAITVANGYKTTVITVEPAWRGRDDVSEGERPYLCWGIDREEYEHQMFANLKVDITWSVYGLISETLRTWTTMSAALNNLVDDVIAAIMADPTLGGHAVTTLLVASETDEADPDRFEGGWCGIDFKTTYHRETTAS